MKRFYYIKYAFLLLWMIISVSALIILSNSNHKERGSKGVDGHTQKSITIANNP